MAQIHKGGLYLTHDLTSHLHNPWFIIFADQAFLALRTSSIGQLTVSRFFGADFRPWVMVNENVNVNSGQCIPFVHREIRYGAGKCIYTILMRLNVNS